MDIADRKHLSGKYRGSEAREYEARRRTGPHWRKEQGIAEQMMRRMHASGARLVLDLPVGTGRFVPLYTAIGLKLIGQDISEDMLQEARNACRREGLTEARIEVGDAFAIQLADKSVDAAICVRFMQHVDQAAFETVMTELQRVARQNILLGIHLVQPSRLGIGRAVGAFAAAPIMTARRIIKGVQRRRQAGKVNADSPAAYMSRADKQEDRVFAYLAKLGLTVVEDAEILTSLRPDKAVSYRFLLLDVPR